MESKFLKKLDQRFLCNALCCVVMALQPFKGLAADFRWKTDAEAYCIMEMRGEIQQGDFNRFAEALLDRVSSEENDTGLSMVDPEALRQAGFVDWQLLESVEYGFSVIKATAEEAEQTYGGSIEYNGQHIGVSNGAGLNICLNSPGGNLSEAFRLFDAFSKLTIGTAIPRGGECESACAVAFLGGRFLHISGQGGNVTEGKARWLDVSGRLGVHAPKLDVLSLNPDNEAISRAYGDAVRQNAELLSRLTEDEYPIATRIVSTPPTEMFYYETVDDSLSIDVEIAGTSKPREIGPRHVVSACQNAINAKRRFGDGSVRYMASRRGGGPWSCPGGIPEVRLSLSDYSNVRFTRQDGSIYGTLSIPNTDCDQWERQSCKVQIVPRSSEAARGSSRRLRWPVWINILDATQLEEGADDAVALFSWQDGEEVLFPPSARISGLGQSDSEYLRIFASGLFVGRPPAYRGPFSAHVNAHGIVLDRSEESTTERERIYLGRSCDVASEVYDGTVWARQPVGKWTVRENRIEISQKGRTELLGGLSSGIFSMQMVVELIRLIQLDC